MENTVEESSIVKLVHEQVRIILPSDVSVVRWKYTGGNKFMNVELKYLIWILSSYQAL